MTPGEWQTSCLAVLDMTVDEGADFFRAVPAIRDKL
jgi:excinuclease UvrABC ATPase subunit